MKRKRSTGIVTRSRKRQFDSFHASLRCIGLYTDIIEIIQNYNVLPDFGLKAFLDGKVIRKVPRRMIQSEFPEICENLIQEIEWTYSEKIFAMRTFFVEFQSIVRQVFPENFFFSFEPVRETLELFFTFQKNREDPTDNDINENNPIFYPYLKCLLIFQFVKLFEISLGPYLHTVIPSECFSGIQVLLMGVHPYWTFKKIYFKKPGLLPTLLADIFFQFSIVGKRMDKHFYQNRRIFLKKLTWDVYTFCRNGYIFVN